MSGRNQPLERIHFSLQNRQGDHFVLTDRRIHSHEPLEFQSKLEAWDFLSDLQGLATLEKELAGHPLLNSWQHTPDVYRIRDALIKGDLSVFITHKDQTRNREEIERLYGEIRLALQQVIASEKAEASAIARQYDAMSDSGKSQAHAGSFGKGLKEAGTSFLIWVKDVVEVISPQLRSMRRIQAFLDTPYEGTVFEWLENVSQTYLKSEYKELIDVLGFDPKNVDPDQFRQAWEITQIIWDDQKCQTLLTQFAKDYYRAQHPLEVSEFAGGAAFEILLTIVLIFTTAGVGVAAQMASKGRLVKQLTQLGKMFKELAELRREVDRYTPKTRMRSRSSGSSVEELATEKGGAYRGSSPPKSPKKAAEDNASTVPESITVLEPGEKGSWNKELNGKLKPNHKYQVGNYLYETDKDGRVSRVSGELDLTKRDRNTYQQTKAGKEDGIKGGLNDDDGGHLVASIFDGPGEQINYAPMNANLNRGAWKRMENKWAEALDSDPPKVVRIDVKPKYVGDNKRPSKFVARYWIDGEPHVSIFKNESAR